MENYLENHKKYNKLLFKYMGYEEEGLDYKSFTPHDPLMGFEILRWVLHKINLHPRDGYKMRVILSMKDDETEVIIQEWYDTSKPDGYINIVHHREICGLKKEETDKETYKEAVLEVSHRAVYNACVDFIIKFT